MSQDDSQERTHEPTQKRQQEAREQGKTPRSRELNTMLVMTSGAIALLITGSSLIHSITIMMQKMFTLKATALTKFDQILHAFNVASISVAINTLPVLITLFIFSIVGSIMIGGWLFSTEALGFKFERMDPLNGIKKMFSMHSLVELVKAILKFFLILCCGIILIWHQHQKILNLGAEPTTQAIYHAIYLLGLSFLCLVATLIIIAGVDVPFQIWHFLQESRMTTQEIKEESKDSDGRPEVKSKMRKMQQTMLQNRMLKDVAKANVIITNPTHFAVAIQYDDKLHHAPLLLAKGKGVIAEQIRKIATENKVPILRAAPLARSLYNTTEIGHEIPSGLYVAVAKVLVYIFQLKQYKTGYGKPPVEIDNLPIPNELQYPEKIEV